MSFATHFEAHNALRDKLRERADDLVRNRIKRPSPKALLTARGRRAWLDAVRTEAVKVLVEGFKEAERLGRTHAAEVLEEWEARK